VSPKAGLDDLEKILDPIGTRTRPARGQSLYRLHYPGSLGDLEIARNFSANCPSKIPVLLPHKVHKTHLLSSAKHLSVRYLLTLSVG
jgi:hypothetical protein